MNKLSYTHIYPVVSLVLILSQFLVLFAPFFVSAEEVGYLPQTSTEPSVVVDGLGNAPIGAPSVLAPSANTANVVSAGSAPALSFTGSVDESSGAFTYSYPLLLPEGRRGMTPVLSLNYDSRKRDFGSIVGLGWELDIPTITRMNKQGADVFYDYHDFASSLSGELAAIDSTPGQYGVYGVKTGYGRYTYTADNTWTTTDKEGITYVYGTNSRHRTQEDSNHISVWYLSSLTDQFGNTIEYDHTKYRGKVYPASIKYLGTDIKIVFTYQTIYSIDANISSLITPTPKTIQTITITDGDGHRIVHTFTYATGTPATTGRVQLTNITTTDENNTVLNSNAMQYQATVNGSVQGDMLTPSHIIPVTFPDGFPCDLRTLTDSEHNYGSGCVHAVVDVEGDGDADFITYKAGLYQFFLYNPVTYTYTEDTTRAFTSSPNHSFIDLDADGDLDVVPKGIYGTSPFLRFTGSSWESFTLPAPASLSLHTPKYFDINQDGFVDAYITDNPETGIRVYLGSPVGFTTSAFMAVGGTPGAGRFIDVNGDTHMDYVTATKEVYLLQGTTFVKQSYQHLGDRDYNGDGMLDGGYTADQSGSNYLITTLSLFLGDSFTSFVPPELTNLVRFVERYHTDGAPNLTTYGSFNNQFFSYSSSKQIPIDFTYDGFTDALYFKGIQNNVGSPIMPAIFLEAPSQLAQQIHQINTYRGGAVNIQYGAEILKNTNSTGTPKTQQVVKLLTFTDPSGVSDQNIISYQYFDGLRHPNYEDTNTPYASFGRVVASDSASIVTTTYFHQGNTTDTAHGEFDDTRHKIGRAYRQETQGTAGELIAQTTTKWNQADLGSNRYFVFPEVETKRVKSGTQWLGTASAYTYNTAYGEVVRVHDFGSAEVADNGSFTDIGTDVMVASTTYITNGVLVRPKIVKTVDSTATTTSLTQYIYDQGGLLDKGLLTTSRTMVAPGAFAETTYTYTSKGLLQSVTDPLGNETNISYDSQGMYPDAVTNALGQKTSYRYAYLSGVPTKIVDPNGLITETVLDGLGRPISVTVDGIVRVTAHYAPSETLIQSPERNDFYYRNYHQPEERYLYEKTRYDGFGNVSTRLDASGYDTYRYNSQGLVSAEYMDGSVWGVNGESFPAPSGDLYTQYTYDSLGRVIATTNVRGTTAYTYNGYESTITDVAGVAKTTSVDARGNILSVVERNGSDTYTTTYTYNSRNLLTGLTDSEGNVRSFDYDFRGLRTALSDLHKPTDTTFGTTYLAYDVLGRVISEQRHDGTRLIRTYDALSRVKQTSVISASADVTPPVAGQAATTEYFYDQGDNAVGHLSSVVSSSGTSRGYQYNKRGELIAENATTLGVTNGRTTPTETLGYSTLLPILTTQWFPMDTSISLNQPRCQLMVNYLLGYSTPLTLPTSQVG